MLLNSTPPKRSSFLRRFFFFCSIILILAAIFIVASIVKTLFGDKGTPAPAEPSAVIEISPSPSAHSSTLTGISISPAEVQLTSSQETVQLSAIPEPETAQIETTVSWSSQNPAVVTVDENGFVKAVNAGNTTVTAVCGEWSATCNVTVDTSAASPSPSENNTSSVGQPSLSRTDFTLASAGDSYQIRISGTTSTATWTVEDPSIATVSDSGVVTAVSRGKTIVTATIDGKTLECIVRVR